MQRHAHMVDLLRPQLSFNDEVLNLLSKHELTKEDLGTIIEKAEQVKRAAEYVKRQRFGK